MSPHWRFRGQVVNELRCLERLGYCVAAVPYFEWVCQTLPDR